MMITLTKKVDADVIKNIKIYRLYMAGITQNKDFFKKRIFLFSLWSLQREKKIKRKERSRGSKNSLDQAQKEKYLKTKN